MGSPIFSHKHLKTHIKNHITYVSLKITNSCDFYPIQLNNTLCKPFGILEKNHFYLLKLQSGL